MTFQTELWLFLIVLTKTGQVLSLKLTSALKRSRPAVCVKTWTESSTFLVSQRRPAVDLSLVRCKDKVRREVGLRANLLITSAFRRNLWARVKEWHLTQGGMRTVMVDIDSFCGYVWGHRFVRTFLQRLYVLLVTDWTPWMLRRWYFSLLLNC